MTWRGRSFQVRVAATGKARSPTVDSRVRRTDSDDVDAERRRVLVSESADWRSSSARYDGAVPWSQMINSPFTKCYAWKGWATGLRTSHFGISNKNLAIANRSRHLRTQYVQGIYRPKYYTVTVRVTQCHWKRNHWIDHTRLTISRVI